MAFTRPTAKTAARGYGGAHAKARKAAAQQHRPTDPCVRCGHPLGPMGPHLHLDHNDQRTGYLGFSHGRRPCPWCGDKCNIRAGARKGQRLAHRTRTKASDTLAVAPVAVARATDGPRASTRIARSGATARPNTAARW